MWNVEALQDHWGEQYDCKHQEENPGGVGYGEWYIQALKHSFVRSLCKDRNFTTFGECEKDNFGIKMLFLRAFAATSCAREVQYRQVPLITGMKDNDAPFF
jgi:hypothetical protein